MDIGILRKPTVFDIVYLIKNIRKADADEAMAFAGKTIEEGLAETPNMYDNSIVWEINGKVACISGTTFITDGVWIIWMLATDEFDKNRKAAKIRSKEVFTKLVEGKRYLFNYVQLEHKKALKWVKWMGCKVNEPEPVGINGELFCKIEVVNV